MLGAVPIPSDRDFTRLADEAYDVVPPERWEDALAQGGLPYVIGIVAHAALKTGYINGVKATIAAAGGAGLLANASELTGLFERITALRAANPDASPTDIADMIRREDGGHHAN